MPATLTTRRAVKTATRVTANGNVATHRTAKPGRLAALTEVFTDYPGPTLAIELTRSDSPNGKPLVISIEVDGSAAEEEAKELNRKFNRHGCFYRVRPVVVHFAD